MYKLTYNDLNGGGCDGDGSCGSGETGGCYPLPPRH